ncbi:MAG: Holliday junction resolvase RuvX [Ignavibacteriales bacterium]|nr:MAG: Holliday junction resolvase RuvX [Ignavibacteriales bacterium]
MPDNSSGDYKRVLAIDYGIKRIGLALSDPLQLIASPYKSIPNNPGLISELKEIIEEQSVEKIILGFPEHDKGTSTSIVKELQSFKTDLENKTGLEIIFWDETFTSSIAKDRVVASVNKKSRRRDKGLIDSNAAAIILQEFLDS